MGLLDQLDDPVNAGLLSMGLRLMSTPGRFGQALGSAGLGAMGDLQAMREQQQKRKIQDAQLQDINAQAQLRQQQAERMNRIQQMIQQMSQPASTQAANQAVIGQTGNLAPTVANAQLQQQARAPQGGPLQGIPPEALQFDLTFNDGKGIASELFQRSRPNMAVHNGVVMDMNQAKPGQTLPQISQNGQASQLIPDPTAPGGYRVITPAGAVDSYRAYKQADADVASGSEIVKVYDPVSKREVYVPKSAVLNPAASPQAEPQPERTAPSQVRPAATRPADSVVAPDVQAGRDRDRLRILNDELAKTASPDDRAALQREISRIRAPKAAAPMAAGPSADENASAAAAKAYDELSAKDLVEIKSGAMKADFSAPSKIAQLQKIGSLLKDYEGGKLSGAAMAFSSAANSLGIKLDPKLPDKEAAQALSREMALQLRDPSAGGGMPGAMSNSDRAFLESMTPELAQTAQGRAQIISARVALLQRQQQVAQAMRNYEKKYNRLDNGFLSQLSAWSEAHPLFGGK